MTAYNCGKFLFLFSELGPTKDLYYFFSLSRVTRLRTNSETDAGP